MKRQKEICIATGLHQATVSNIMTGRRRPSWKNAKKLAEVTGTKPELWMEGTPAQIKAAISQTRPEIYPIEA